MKTKNQKYLITAATVAIVTTALLAGCGGPSEAELTAAKYTEETAKAIVEGSWKVAGSILFGFVLHALLS